MHLIFFLIRRKKELKTKASPKFKLSSISLVIIIVGIIGISCFILLNNLNKITTKDSIQNEKNIIADMPSILVMPFENQTGKEENNFVGSGFTSSLINILSQSQKLQIHSSSTGKYVKENNLNINDISKLYNIEYILNGSVQGHSKTTEFS